MEQPPSHSLTASRLGGKRVLLCVEDPGLMGPLSGALSRTGAEVVSRTGSGLEAVRLAELHLPEMILIDQALTGITGLEAALRILADRPTCVVIFAEKSAAALVSRAGEDGLCGCIIKPISPELLIPQLENALQVFYEAQP